MKLTAPRTLTVATYNIRHGQDVAFDWSRLAAHITGCRADVVGLQEVDVGTGRVSGVNIVSAMKAATGLAHAVFAPAMRFQGGFYGVAILSRYPILYHENLPLPIAVGQEPRVCARALLDIGGGGTVDFLTTHLTFNSRGVREKQIASIRDHLPHTPFVLTGDLNTADAGELTPLLTHPLTSVNHPSHPLMTFRQPPVAIDHIVYDTRQWAVVHHGMVDAADSDHNLLYAALERKF